MASLNAFRGWCLVWFLSSEIPSSLKTLFLKSPIGGLRGYEETMLQDPEGSDFTQLVVAASFLRTI